ncbi:YfiR family protein [Gammaproteobacteria bacterium]
MPAKRIFLLLLSGCIALLDTGNLWASDAELRLGFLVNFARFTEWPEAVLPAGALLRICIAPGDAEMVSKLADLTRQTVQEHPVQTRLITRPDEVKGCHLLYLPAELPPPLTPWLMAANRAAALSVGDAPDLASDGGMIELVLLSGRYRFDVNLASVRQANLRISAYLLKLARTVK